MDGVSTNQSTSKAPPSTVIAALFVEKYYKALHDNPANILQFYAEDAEFSRLGGKEEVTATAHESILERVQSLRYEKCKVLCDTLDCQKTLDDGLVVVARGHMTNAGGPRRPFVQTFVLERRSQVHYLVRNDILRYTDDLPVFVKPSIPPLAGFTVSPAPPSSYPSPESKAAAVPSANPPELSVVPPAAAAPGPSVPSAPVMSPASAGPVDAVEPPAVPAAAAPEVAPMPSPPNEAERAGAAAPESSPAALPQRQKPKRAYPREKRPKKSEKPALESVPVESPPAQAVQQPEPSPSPEAEPAQDAVQPAVPKSWAGLFNKQGTSVSPRLNVKPPSKSRPAKSAVPNGVPAVAASGDESKGVPVNGTKPHARPPQPASTLSVSNLPAHVKEDEVRKLFSPFGDIKQIQMPQPPRFSLCLIHFFSAESAQKALDARPLSLDSVALNVELRARSGPRAGGRAGAGRTRPPAHAATTAAPSPSYNGTSEPSPSGSNEDKDGAGFERVASRNRYRPRGRGGMVNSKPRNYGAPDDNKNGNSRQNGAGVGKPNGNPRKRKPANAGAAAESVPAASS